jgi:hypothetical protein
VRREVFTLAEMGVHDGEIAVHDGEIGVHDAAR